MDIKNLISQAIISSLSDEDIVNGIKLYDEHFQSHVNEALIELDPITSKSIAACMSGLIEARRLLVIEQNNRAAKADGAASESDTAEGFDFLGGTFSAEDRLDNLFSAIFGEPEAEKDEKPRAQKSPLEDFLDGFLGADKSRPEANRSTSISDILKDLGL